MYISFPPLHLQEHKSQISCVILDTEKNKNISDFFLEKKTKKERPGFRTPFLKEWHNTPNGDISISKEIFPVRGVEETGNTTVPTMGTFKTAPWILCFFRKNGYETNLATIYVEVRMMPAFLEGLTCQVHRLDGPRDLCRLHLSCPFSQWRHPEGQWSFCERAFLKQPEIVCHNSKQSL